jgi:hypothetical protein
MTQITTTDLETRPQHRAKENRHPNSPHHLRLGNSRFNELPLYIHLEGKSENKLNLNYPNYPPPISNCPSLPNLWPKIEAVEPELPNLLYTHPDAETI